MNVQKSLMLFFSICFLFLFSIIIINYYLFKERQQAFRAKEFKEKKFSAGITIKITSRTLEKLVFDYTYWDDMVNFIYKPDSAWAKDNIDNLLETSGSHYIWIYTKQNTLLYHCKDSTVEDVDEPISINELNTLFDTITNGKKRFAHYYYKTKNKVLEIASATIHKTSDKLRKEHANGFMFVGKIINTTYLKELTDMTNMAVSVESTESVKDTGDYRIIKEALFDWKKNQVANLRFYNSDDFEQKENQNNLLAILLYSIVIILVIIASSFFIRKKISIPIASISKSLNQESLKYIKKTINNKDEFGQIARLIEKFFKQQIELKDKNDELVQLNEEIRQQNEEIITQTEQLESINKELEKLSIVASKTDNSVIIADPNGEIEWANDGFERMLGISYHEFSKRYGTNFIKTSLNPNIEQVVKECIEKKQSVIYSARTITTEGREIWIQTTLTPIFDIGNNLEKFIAIDSDITQIKQAEARIALQSQNIRKSIQYARRIQAALLEPISNFTDIFPEHFIFLRPKDIVSGDFHWFMKKDNKIYFTVVDCTGHGVPGAFMSILAVSFLNEIVRSVCKTCNAGQVLDRIRELVIKSLHQSDLDAESKDGMDIALCILDLETKKLDFAGAHNSVFIVTQTNDNLKSYHSFSNHQFSLYDIQGDKMPVGIHKNMNSFKNHVIDLQTNDMLYLTSDGYGDQFGGAKGRKYLKSNLKKLILENAGKPMDVQKMLLDKNLKSWRGREKQVDDILIVGLKIS